MVKYGGLKIEIGQNSKMTYTLRVSTLALSDIEDAIYWYKISQEGLGRSLQQKLYEGLEYINQYPFILRKNIKR